MVKSSQVGSQHHQHLFYCAEIFGSIFFCAGQQHRRVPMEGTHPSSLPPSTHALWVPCPHGMHPPRPLGTAHRSPQASCTWLLRSPYPQAGTTALEELAVSMDSLTVAPELELAKGAHSIQVSVRMEGEGARVIQSRLTVLHRCRAGSPQVEPPQPHFFSRHLAYP